MTASGMARQTGDDFKPWVAVLGGCGFIGRNLVEYLISNGLASGVRVVDKVPPQTAWLNKKHAAIFEDHRVEFRSANLINPASCKSALQPGPGFDNWDVVINCAGETKLGQTDLVYKEGILILSLNCAKECSQLRVKRYVEISSGCMYSSEKNPHKEDGPVEPWTFVSKWKSQVEEEIKKNDPELEYIFVRPGIVYGLGDRRGLTPRLLVGAVYKQLGEMMKLMWTPDLKLNTVSVLDACRAIWFLSQRNDTVRQTYNLVDKGESTQGKITDIISEIFNINHDYWGTTMSSAAKADLTSLLDEANDKHLASWAEACSAEGIQNTPLDPYMTSELLLNRHINLDGSKLEALGFKLQIECITKDKLQEVIEDYVEMGVFPKSLVL